jgi:FAD/FMN-containing dehydrogenase
MSDHQGWLGPDWEALQRGLCGLVALPGSVAYERARPPFVAWFDDLQPQAVVSCAAAGEVAQALAFARRNGLAVAVRSGGHCFAGFSSARGLVVDVSPLRSVDVADGVVRVGAGARLGELYERLLEHGLTVPAGTCPSVGIGGLALGGGHGILGRAYGLTLDHLAGAEVVLADGRVAICDEHRDGDLFWALRGAGAGNFGVVTSLTFRPRPAPASMANFHLAWPHERAAAVIAAWQRWAPPGPVELAADLELTAAGDRAIAPTVAVYGAVLGTRRDADRLLDELTALAGADPASRVCSELSFRDTVRYQAAPDAGGGQMAPGAAEGQAKPAPAGDSARRCHRFTKSEFFDRPLPSQAIAALAGHLAGQRTPGQDRSVMFAPWAGAYNQQPSQATAFAHRSQLFLLEHQAVTTPGAAAAAYHAAHQWVTTSWASVHRQGSGRVYPNFPDPGLTDPGRAYYGDNLPRLRTIKARYDPEGVFGSRQPLLAR